MGDNGISAYVAKITGIEPAPAGEISCALGGNGVLTTHLQEQPFYVGREVSILRPIVPLTKQETLFYCLCIKSNRYRYSYGRQANKTLKDLLVPSLKELPDWVDDVNPDAFAGLGSSKLKGPIANLNSISTKPFKLTDLFTLHKGRRLTKLQMTVGDTPYIGATDSNNGITMLIGQAPIFKANTITVSYDGSIGEAFFQEVPYWASDAVNVLEPKFTITAAIAMYICTAIRQEKYRFNYGRKWHLERMSQSSISLPIDCNQNPDWLFMQSFIERLPFSRNVT